MNLKPALDLIKTFEGLYLNAYSDPVGIPTIGYGTICYPNGQKVRLGEFCTIAQADEYLQFEIDHIVDSLNKLIDVGVTDNEFCAVISFCYNLGLGAFSKSSLRAKLNSNMSRDLIATEFDRWVHAGSDGKVFPGLVRRRKAEKSLFLS